MVLFASYKCLNFIVSQRLQGMKRYYTIANGCQNYAFAFVNICQYSILDYLPQKPELYY